RFFVSSPPLFFPAGPGESSQTTKSAKQSESLLKEMRRINAPFNDYRLIRFDTAVRIYLNPTGSWVAFNRLASSHDQPAHPSWDASCCKPEASGAACASAR